MIRTKMREIIVSDAVEYICDICGKVANKNNDADMFEFEEFTHIDQVCGYGSVFGDGSILQLDICQTCLRNFLIKAGVQLDKVTHNPRVSDK